MHFSARKKHLKKQKWQFDPQHSAAQRRCQGTFFSGGNFTPIFEAKKVGTSGQNCPGHFTLLNLAQKVPFLKDLKKKVSKSDWNQRHIVYVTQILYYTWFQITFGPKNAITLAKNYNFLFFKNSHFRLF